MAGQVDRSHLEGAGILERGAQDDARGDRREVAGYQAVALLDDAIPPAPAVRATPLGPADYLVAPLVAECASRSCSHFRLRLLQPEPHVHLAVHGRRGGEARERIPAE